MNPVSNMLPSEIPKNAKYYLTGLIFSGLGDGAIMTVAQLYFIAVGLSISLLLETVRLNFS